jgi:hypothetical protein
MAFAARPDTITTIAKVKDAKIIYDAIIRGCEERGWNPSKSGDNEISATLYTRGHSVVVRIPYSENGYEIIYADSKNMRYSARSNTIHPKYHQWTANLNKSIRNNIDFKKGLQ